MPFGLTFAQMVDLGNKVPGLVDDVKKAAPKLAPLLDQGAAMLESSELQALLTKVRDLLYAKDTQALLAHAAVLIDQAKSVAPELAPIARKASALLHVISTSDSHAEASAKIAAMPIDRATSGTSG